ncbi:MAG: hypothetical protein FJY85_10665, partial [Deltaproteobacteria bacterium]|nr:hypothetical protein [Deltaproteobacteria bacterium]
LGHGKEKDGSPRLLAALIIVVTSGGVWSPTNLTSTTTSIALFYALLRTFFLREEAVSRLARLFLMALMVSGLIALKTSNVPGCGLIILALFLGVGHKPFRRRIADLVILGLVSLIMLIPWVLGRTGSGFFPTWGLAGRGLVDFPFGPFDTLMACPGRWLVLISMHVVTSFLLLAGLAMVFLPYGKALDALLCRRTRVLILAAAWGTALIQSLLSCEIGIEAINRYTVATVASSTYFLLVEYLSFRGQGQEALTNWARNPALIGLMALSFILGASLPQAKLLALRRYSAYRNPSQAPVNLEAGRLRSMQASIPEGEPIFVWISKPFLLDFKRNYVFNVDVPGAASLAPGLPWEGPSERIAHYLRSMSIRYLVYSYADGGGFPPFKNMDWLRDQRIGLRAATRIATAFQKNLETLGRTYPRVYDDGYLFVLDLRVF